MKLIAAALLLLSCGALAAQEPEEELFITVPSEWATSFEQDPNAPVLIIHDVEKGKDLVHVMPDGSVKLFGDPNEAAKIFWEAVEGAFTEGIRKKAEELCGEKTQH